MRNYGGFKHLIDLFSHEVTDIHTECAPQTLRMDNIAVTSEDRLGDLIRVAGEFKAAMSVLPELTCLELQDVACADDLLHYYVVTANRPATLAPSGVGQDSVHMYHTIHHSRE